MILRVPQSVGQLHWICAGALSAEGSSSWDQLNDLVAGAGTWTATPYGTAAGVYHTTK